MVPAIGRLGHSARGRGHAAPLAAGRRPATRQRRALAASTCRPSEELAAFFTWLRVFCLS